MICRWTLLTYFLLTYLMKKGYEGMNNLQKIGGIAALIEAGTFIIGFALFFTVLDAAGYGAGSPAQSVAFLTENQTIMYVWNLIIFIIFGIALVVLALALHQQLKTGAPALMQVATAFGLIWSGLVIASGMVANIGLGTVVDLYATDPAQAALVWLTINSVENGLGGGNEIAGGVWVLLVSLAALQAGGLVRTLNYLGVVIGVAGLLTVIPALEMFGAIFGLGLIVWFVWLGFVMLRRNPQAAFTLNYQPKTSN